MTQREMSPDVLLEVAKQQCSPFHLYQFHFDSATLYFTDAGYDIPWDANTYISAKALAIDAIEESVNFEVSDITITLSGVDQAILAVFLTEPFLNRAVIVYKAFMASTGTIVSDPFLYFEGRMDGPSYTEDTESGTATITVPASDEFIDFESTNGRKRSLCVGAGAFCNFD